MSFNNNIPFEKLYRSSLKEASRKKPVFFIHKYFARRITANFRMALLDYIYDDNEIFQHFYESSLGKGKGITVLDPFMGGGTTIFEALRFGCNVIGNDLQPLSLFTSKALVAPIDEETVEKAVNCLEKTVGEKIRSYYKTTCPCCGKRADVMYAFHVKTVTTSSFCKQHRLFSSFVIAYKKDEFVVVCPKCGKLHKTKFESGCFVCDCGWTLNSPKDSYVNNGVFKCPDCHEQKILSDYGTETGYPFTTDIIAIEYYCPYCKSHDYKAPDIDDIALKNKACEDFANLEYLLPIPQQVIPKGHNTNQILNHGYRRFKDLFNERQLLCLGFLLREINSITDKDTQLWLQLAFSGMLEMNNMFCRYQQNAYKICNIFFNHAYVPISMPVENCIWGTELGTGTFEKTIKKIIRGKRFNKNIYDLSVKEKANGQFSSVKIESDDIVLAEPVSNFGEITYKNPVLHCSDSRDLSFIPDETVDLVLTDPPYGANVMYSELIDFFHVWNFHSSISEQMGFVTELSPKNEEIIINPILGKEFDYYQDGITAVFSECYKKLKKNGYLVFSFHDKNLDSWLSVLESINNAGFVLNKCYPVQSETRTGAHTSGKNSIGIDVMLICKKIIVQPSQQIFTEKNTIQIALNNTKKQIIEILDKFKSVSAELTAPDIQNIAISIFFSQLPDYYIFDKDLKRTAIDELHNLLNNIDDVAGDFEIARKRNGWWSELYRQKWEINV